MSGFLDTQPAAGSQLSLSITVDEAFLSPWEEGVGGLGERFELSPVEMLEGMYFSKCSNTSHVSCRHFFILFYLHFREKLTDQFRCLYKRTSRSVLWVVGGIPSHSRQFSLNE